MTRHQGLLVVSNACRTNACCRRRAGRAAADTSRVCQAWHRTSEVKVLAPGDRGAEGEEKGKGVTARLRRELSRTVGSGGSPIQPRGATYRNPAQAGWGTTRDESRHRRDDREVLHPQRGVLYKSGVYAPNVLCLTLGDLPTVRTRGLRTGKPGLTGRQKSAEGIGGPRQARLVRHPTAERRGNR
jgi:hypothetical protein